MVRVYVRTYWLSVRSIVCKTKLRHNMTNGSLCNFELIVLDLFIGTSCWRCYRTTRYFFPNERHNGQSWGADSHHALSHCAHWIATFHLWHTHITPHNDRHLSSCRPCQHKQHCTEEIQFGSPLHESNPGRILLFVLELDKGLKPLKVLCRNYHCSLAPPSIYQSPYRYFHSHTTN